MKKSILILALLLTYSCTKKECKDSYVLEKKIIYPIGQPNQYWVTIGKPSKCGESTEKFQVTYDHFNQLVEGEIYL